MVGRTFLTPEELPKRPSPPSPSVLDHQPGQGPQREADIKLMYGGDPTPWQAGADGERAFAAAVAPLREAGWMLLHALPCRDGDIDHVLISDRGVYTVNSKNLASDLHVSPRSVGTDRTEVELIFRARMEADFAARVLAESSGIPVAEVLVTPVIVAITSQVHGHGVDPAAPGSADVPVAVLELDQVLDWFTARPVILTAAVTGRLQQAAQPLRAWRNPAFDRTDSSGEQTRLDGLM